MTHLAPQEVAMTIRGTKDKCVWGEWSGLSGTLRGAPKCKACEHLALGIRRQLPGTWRNSRNAPANPSSLSASGRARSIRSRPTTKCTPPFRFASGCGR
jgi:hypothetical protein